ncbi:MAG: nucleoside phosphorylase [Planctomycetes bacterium]|nr:nucleoside phosphorylase [Planctomycetota bacterium]
MPGKQYHLGLKSGEVAKNILLCGDPARAEKISCFFDKISLHRKNREFTTFTGRYKNIPLSVIGTGIGPDNTEIALIELSQIVKNPTLIRIGSCGGLQKNINLGNLVISTGALRMENTSTFFVPDGYPALAHYEVVQALKEAVSSLKVKHHLGITATAPGFYGAQGRKVKGFPLRQPDMVDYFRRIGVLNFEMETSTLLTLANMRGFRAGSVCSVYADRYHYKFISPTLKNKAELNCIRTGLKAIQTLHNN